MIQISGLCYNIVPVILSSLISVSRFMLFRDGNTGWREHVLLILLNYFFLRMLLYRIYRTAFFETESRRNLFNMLLQKHLKILSDLKATTLLFLNLLRKILKYTFWNLGKFKVRFKGICNSGKGKQWNWGFQQKTLKQKVKE